MIVNKVILLHFTDCAKIHAAHFKLILSWLQDPKNSNYLEQQKV